VIEESGPVLIGAAPGFWNELTVTTQDRELRASGKIGAAHNTNRTNASAHAGGTTDGESSSVGDPEATRSLSVSRRKRGSW